LRFWGQSVSDQVPIRQLRLRGPDQDAPSQKSESPRDFKAAKSHTLRAYVRNCRGATALEFALIATPLMALIFVCLQMALYVMVCVSLDNATQRAAREIRMGITTAANSTSTTFRQKVCDNLGWLGTDCMANLKLDVDSYDNFSMVTLVDPITNGNFTSDLNYDIGGASRIQLVRTYLTWEMVIPFISNPLATMSDGKAVISSKVVFRNEPF
jgi:Flp pilus assembly protein TadG